MENRGMLLLRLRRSDNNYQICATEALRNADEAIKIGDIKFAEQLINEFVFETRIGRINSSHELQLAAILLSDFFAFDNPARLPLFYNIFDMTNRKLEIRKSVLMKFIICAIGIRSRSALNVSGTYLFDRIRMKIMAHEFINEINMFACNSYEKVKTLPFMSPMFANALCLGATEVAIDSRLPQNIIQLMTDFMHFQPLSPIIFAFTIPSHIEIGSHILCCLFKLTILSELENNVGNEVSFFNKLHVKLLEFMSNFDVSSFSKPHIYTPFLEMIADRIFREKNFKDAKNVQNSLEKFAHMIQISKGFLIGNIPKLVEKLRRLPKNYLMELVIKS